jgi:hypothetical protein
LVTGRGWPARYVADAQLVRDAVAVEVGAGAEELDRLQADVVGAAGRDQQPQEGLRALPRVGPHDQVREHAAHGARVDLPRRLRRELAVAHARAGHELHRHRLAGALRAGDGVALQRPQIGRGLFGQALQRAGAEEVGRVAIEELPRLALLERVADARGLDASSTALDGHVVARHTALAVGAGGA